MWCVRALAPGDLDWQVRVKKKKGKKEKKKKTNKIRIDLQSTTTKTTAGHRIGEAAVVEGR